MEKHLSIAFNESRGEPIVVMSLGGHEAGLFSWQTLWTFVGTPGFAFMRPWWLASFSLSLLTSNTIKIQANLAPGLCPFHPRMNLQDLNQIQSLLKDFFQKNTSLINYIKKTDSSFPTKAYSNGSNITPLPKNRAYSEEWLSFESDEYGNTATKSNGLGNSTSAWVALLLSFLVAGLIGFTVLMAFKAGVIIILRQIRSNCAHSQNYKMFILRVNSQREEINEEEINQEERQPIQEIPLMEESSFANFMRKVPRISAFLGHYSLLLGKRYLIDSVSEFYDHLFNPNLPLILRDYKLGRANRKYLEMKETTLKNLYEKFCFLNNYQENPLSSESSLLIPNKYSFFLEEDPEGSIVFSHVIEKSDKLQNNNEELEKTDSIDSFFQSFCRKTNNDLDYLFAEDLQKEYALFCSRNKLEILPWKLDSFCDRFGLGLLNIKRKVLRKRSGKVEEVGKVLKDYKNEYFIDEALLNCHYDAIVNPEVFYMGLQEEEKIGLQILKRMVYRSRWYYWVLMDIGLILLNFMVMGAMILPFMLLVLLNESSYTIFSTNDPDSLISFEDVLEAPWILLSVRVLSLMFWNQIIIFFSLFYAGLSLVDSFLYFFHSSFPEERNFIDSQNSLEKKPLWKILANLQWILVFFFIFCYSAYVGLACVWLILGAIINPNNFLVYATSAVTFLIFIRTKYQSFQELSQNGIILIQKAISRLLIGQIKDVVGSIVRETLERDHLTLPQKGFSKAVIEKAEELGLTKEIGMLKTVREKVMGSRVDKVGEAEDIKEKAKELQQNIKDKSIKLFTEKCLNLNIPENIIQLFLMLIFKDYPSLKIRLSELISCNSQSILGFHIPSELLTSLLTLLTRRETFKKEDSYQIFHSFLAESLCFLLKEVLPSGINLPNHEKKLLVEVWRLVSAVKIHDKRQLIHSFNESLILLDLFPPEQMKHWTFLLQIMDILGSGLDETNLNIAILNLINQVYLPERLVQIVGLLLKASYHDPVIAFQDLKLSTLDHLKYFFLGFLKPFSKNHNLHEWASGLAVFVRILKGQFAEPEYKELEKLFEVFEDEIGLGGNCKGTLKKVFYKAFGVLPLVVSAGKDFKRFWRELAGKMRLDIEMINELLTLMTKEYYQMLGLERSSGVLNGIITEAISKKLKFKKESLLGFIEIFYENLVSRYAEIFLKEIFLLEDFDEELQKKAKELALVVLSINPFYTQNKLEEIMPGLDITPIYSYLCQLDKNFSTSFKFKSKDDPLNNQKTSIEPVEKDKIPLKMQKTFFNESLKKEKNSIFDSKEPQNNKSPSKRNKNFHSSNSQKDENPLNQDHEEIQSLSTPQKTLDIQWLINNFFNKEELSPTKAQQLLECLTSLQSLFDIRGFKEDLSGSVKMKMRITDFCSRYDLEEEAFTSFLYLIINDSTKVPKALKIFLPHLEESHMQLLSLNIYNEEIMMENTIKTIPLFLRDWMPSSLLRINPQNFFKAFYLIKWKNYRKKHILDLLRKLIEFSSKGEVGYNLELQQDNYKRIVSMLYLAKSPEQIKEIFPLLQDPHFKEPSERILHFFNIFTKEERNLEDIAGYLQRDLLKEFLLGKQDIKELLAVFRMLTFREERENYPFMSPADMEFEVYIGERFGVTFEILRKLRSYFTILPSAFSLELIPEFIAIHGADILTQSQLESFFSLCHDSIQVDKLSKLLKISSFDLESIQLIRSYYFSKEKGPVMIRIRESFASKRWCRDLGLQFGEFYSLMRLLNQESTINEVANTLISFEVHNVINFELLLAIAGFFLKDPKQMTQKKRELHYRKILQSRSFLYKTLEVCPTQADLTCDLLQNRFWFFYQQLFHNSAFKELGLLPRENLTTIAEVLSGLLGVFLNESLTVFDISDLLLKIRTKTLTMGNNLETACYLFYKHFGLSPLVVLLFLDLPFAKKYLDNIMPDLYKEWIDLMDFLSVLSFTDRMALCEEEWAICLYERAHSLDIQKKLFSKEEQKEGDFVEKNKASIAKLVYIKLKAKIDCIRVFEQVNIFGFPLEEKPRLFSNNFPFNSLMLMFWLNQSRLAWENRDSNSFTICLDLAFSCCERLKFLKESFQSFIGFRKNSWVKILVQTLFMNTEKDFTGEFFLVPSLYEPNFIEIICKERNNPELKGQDSLQNSLAACFLFKKNLHGFTMEDLYLRRFFLHESISQFLYKGIPFPSSYDLLLDKVNAGDFQDFPKEKTRLLEQLVKGNQLISESYYLLSFFALEASFLPENEDQPLERTIAEITKFEKTLKAESRGFFARKNLVILYNSSLLNQEGKKVIRMETPLIQTFKTRKEDKEEGSFKRSFKENFIEKEESLTWANRVAEFLSVRFQNVFLGEFNTSKKFFGVLIIALARKGVYLDPGVMDAVIDNLASSMSSDYHNLKLLIHLFMDHSITEKEIERVLRKLRINNSFFFALNVCYAKMLYSHKEIDGNILSQIPLCLQMLIFKKSLLKRFLKPNEVSDPGFNSLSEFDIKSKLNFLLKNLLSNTTFSSKQKQHLILMLKSHFGSREDLKILFSSLNHLEILPSQEKRLLQFLEIVDSFNHTSRKPYTYENLKKGSILEMILVSKSSPKDILFNQIAGCLTDNAINKTSIEKRLFFLRTTCFFMEKDFGEVPILFEEGLFGDKEKVPVESTILKLGLMILGLNEEDPQGKNSKFLSKIFLNENINIKEALQGRLSSFLYILFFKLFGGNYCPLYKGLAQLGELESLSFLFLFNLNRLYEPCLRSVDYEERKYVSLFVINGLIDIANVISKGFFQLDIKELAPYREFREFLKRHIFHAHEKFKAIIKKYEENDFSWFNPKLIDYFFNLWLDFKHFLNNEGLFLKESFESIMPMLSSFLEQFLALFNSIKTKITARIQEFDKIDREFLLDYFFPLFIKLTGFVTDDFFEKYFLSEFGVKVEAFGKSHFPSHVFEFQLLLKTLILIKEISFRELKNQKSGIFSYLLGFYEDLSKVFEGNNQDFVMIFEAFKSHFVTGTELRDTTQKDFKEFFQVLLQVWLKRFLQRESFTEKDGENNWLKALKKLDLDYGIFHHVISQMQELFEDFNENCSIHDTQKITKATRDLGLLLFPREPDLFNLLPSLVFMYLGRLQHVDLILLRLFKISLKQLEAIIKLTEEFESLLKPAQQLLVIAGDKDDDKVSASKYKSLDQVVNKINAGEVLTNGDLFKAFDIDQSGKISLVEFRLLTKRLRMNLSEHRIIEIFTTVSRNPDVSSRELDEKEFELALSYLQNKSIMMTLETLGITQEILIIILIWLTILLLLIFAFIFVGIAAFSVGGTFGAIINSIFPIGFLFLFYLLNWGF